MSFGKKIWPKSQVRSYLLGLLYCSCSISATLYARILYLTETRWVFLVGTSGGVRKHVLNQRYPVTSSSQVFPDRHVLKSLSIQYEQITDYTSCFSLTHIRSSGLGKAEYRGQGKYRITVSGTAMQRYFLSIISFYCWVVDWLGFFCCWFWWISFHISNPFWNPFISLASTASCGNEFYNLIMQCVKKHFPLFAEIFLDDNFI